MRISDWSSDVCSSDLHVQSTGRPLRRLPRTRGRRLEDQETHCRTRLVDQHAGDCRLDCAGETSRRSALECRPGVRGPGHDTWRGGPSMKSMTRSDERRVGKEGVSTGRSRWAPYKSKKK